MPVRVDTRDSRPLLARILDTPNLARVVPRLPPEVLHRVIRACGLEDCGEIIMLATPVQLAEVFDLDLWCTDQPGVDEQFDAHRFGIWLEVLAESGAGVAARSVAAMDVHLVVAGLAQHAFVFDGAAGVRSVSDGFTCEIGGYRLLAKRHDSWDAIAAVLMALDADHPDYLHRVMRGCRRLSNSAREVDGLDHLLTIEEQAMFDLAIDRERRREARGFVTPAQARAFLQLSRQLKLGGDGPPPVNPVTAAYFRGIDGTGPTGGDDDSTRAGPTPAPPPMPDETATGVEAIVGVLVDAGVLPAQPRGLLDAPDGQAPRLGRIQAHMQVVRDVDGGAYAARGQELAFLANAIAAGCFIQARAVELKEATDAAVAACNLGLENWPAHWLPKGSRHPAAGPTATALPDDFLVDHDLVTVFQVGWTVLHEKVCMYAADRLIRVLAHLRCGDRETQAALDELRLQMTRHWRAGAPWRASDALDAVAILDMPAWATLLGLIGECPVIHAGLGASRDPGARAVSATAFEFIAENSQIAAIDEFMRLLPDTLRP